MTTTYDEEPSQLSRLFEACADEAELVDLSMLALRAGLLWACPDPECGQSNDDRLSVCASCGARRPAVTNPPKIESAEDLWDLLHQVADDGESDVLEQLGVDSGFRWKCQSGVAFGHGACGWVNVPDDMACGGCGAPRPREVPDA